MLNIFFVTHDAPASLPVCIRWFSKALMFYVSLWISNVVVCQENASHPLSICKRVCPKSTYCNHFV